MDITTHLPLYSFQWPCLIYRRQIAGWAFTSWKPVLRCGSSARFIPWMDGWLSSAWDRGNKWGLHTFHVKSALGDRWLPLETMVRGRDLFRDSIRLNNTHPPARRECAFKQDTSANSTLSLPSRSCGVSRSLFKFRTMFAYRCYETKAAWLLFV